MDAGVVRWAPHLPTAKALARFAPLWLTGLFGSLKPFLLVVGFGAIF
jgi:hypothetical protein